MRLCTVCQRKGWVWAVAGRSSDEQVAVGGEGGKLEVYKLQFEDLTAIHEVRVPRFGRIQHIFRAQSRERSESLESVHDT